MDSCSRSVASIGVWDSVALWRWTTGASLAGAMAMLLMVVLRPAAPPRPAAALLQVGGTTEVFLVEQLSGNGLSVRAVMPVAVASGKDLELWALSAGTTRPVSLGVIPAVAQRLVVQHPGVQLVQNTKLLVSLEPKGGSPTGQPTGPVLFAGTLTE